MTTVERLPPEGLPAGALGWPSVDDAGNVAALACDKESNDISGIYHRAAAPGSPLRRIADTSMPARAAGGPNFHLFFSVSLAGRLAVFTANAQCHPGDERYEAGVVVASDSGGRDWVLTPVAGLCDPNPSPSTSFVGFGDAVLSEDLVGFMAQTADGKEGIYRYQIGQNATVKPVVRAGSPAPGSSSGVVFSQFPESPSVYQGEFVFLAVLSTGATGIYRADREGRISKLLDTTDTLEGNRTLVYLGLGGNALGAGGAYAFYASTVGPAGHDPWDGVYLGAYA